MDKIDSALFARQAQMIDMSQVDFDILGLKEFPSSVSGDVYKVHKVITLSELVEYAEKNNVDIYSRCVCLSGMCNEKKHSSSRAVAVTIAELKYKLILDAIQEMRSILTKDYAMKLESSSTNYKIKVVQLIKVPLSFLDLAPGDTSIAFDLLTERRLGTLDE